VLAIKYSCPSVNPNRCLAAAAEPIAEGKARDAPESRGRLQARAEMVSSIMSKALKTAVIGLLFASSVYSQEFIAPGRDAGDCPRRAPNEGRR
jgi:hypothetical protein